MTDAGPSRVMHGSRRRHDMGMLLVSGAPATEARLVSRAFNTPRSSSEVSLEPVTMTPPKANPREQFENRFFESAGSQCRLGQLRLYVLPNGVFSCRRVALRDL